MNRKDKKEKSLKIRFKPLVCLTMLEEDTLKLLTLDEISHMSALLQWRNACIILLSFQTKLTELKAYCSVAKIGKEIVGWAAGQKSSNDSLEYFISIFVKEAHRRNGIGTELFKNLTTNIKNKHTAQKVQFLYKSIDKPGKNFYKKVGNIKS